MKTAPTNKKVRELINAVKDGTIVPRPEFQRRLVWSRQDKNHFLDSILRGYPFPEIYLADGSVDLETGKGTQLLVDGLQRVNTMIEYFVGSNELKLTSVPAYKDLRQEEKSAFLQYDVAVRDLGTLTREEIVEVFRRINATKYSLQDIEINNALYSGQLKTFASRVSDHHFFERHRIFSSLDYKRMGDLRYSIGLIVAIMGGYSNRDDVFEEYLSRYNDEFPDEKIVEARLERVLAFLDECGFDDTSRIWRKADLYTAIVEIDYLLEAGATDIQPSVVLDRLGTFYAGIETAGVSGSTLSGIYYKATVQASNDRSNRVRRGLIISGILTGVPEEVILQEFQREGV
ncbi:DUF262 domain-containing protein [Brevundimonas aurantiaca]|uniref:DUF262 domain-containing protein n=1 Tax=Brevundimonas aurantiaca TaxID=74316 RepID=UPI00174CB8C2|nr:DUF262 domain-containing protein [Brevundimonas aurantiaca]